MVAGSTTNPRNSPLELLVVCMLLARDMRRAVRPRGNGTCVHYSIEWPFFKQNLSLEVRGVAFSRPPKIWKLTMKSMQLNYFASGSDLLQVAQIIIAWQPNRFIFAPRFHGNVLRGRPVREASELIPTSCGEMHLLCFADDQPRVRTTQVDGSTSCIRLHENPVIEYSPSSSVDEETVKIGRFYVNFDDPHLLKQVGRLFAQLKKAAVLLDESGLLVFPTAARTKRTLRPWGGKDWDNPLR